MGVVRAIDDPRRFRDAEEEEQAAASANRGGDAEDLDGAFAEGTVYRKRVEQPSSEEAWYAGYIREIEGLKSMDEEEEEEEEGEEVADGVGARREKVNGGAGRGGNLELCLTSSPGSVTNAVAERGAKSSG